MFEVRTPNGSKSVKVGEFFTFDEALEVAKSQQALIELMAPAGSPHLAGEVSIIDTDAKVIVGGAVTGLLDTWVRSQRRTTKGQPFHRY